MFQIEITAKTPQKAIEDGLIKLGLERDDVDIKILETGGFLRKAKVVLFVPTENLNKNETIKSLVVMQQIEQNIKNQNLNVINKKSKEKVSKKSQKTPKENKNNKENVKSNSNLNTKNINAETQDLIRGETKNQNADKKNQNNKNYKNLNDNHLTTMALAELKTTQAGANSNKSNELNNNKPENSFLNTAAKTKHKFGKNNEKQTKNNHPDRGDARKQNSKHNLNASEENLQIIPINENLHQIEKLQQFISGFIDAAKIQVDISTRETEKEIFIDLFGAGSGKLIGYHGEALNAIQHVLSVFNNNISRQAKKVRLDVDSFKQKRRKTIESLATRMAKKVSETGISVKLEPMSAYERRLVHSIVYKFKDLESRSMGKEPRRYLIIEKAIK